MRFLACCLAGVIRGVARTWRVEVAQDARTAENRNVVYAFRHGDLLALAAIHRDQGVHVMVSRSRDGQFASDVVSRLGYHTIRGSSSKGGGAALRLGLRRLKEGAAVGVAVDGPRGPRGKVRPGVEFLATKSGCVVRWAVIEASSAIRLRSWDRFAIPLPFSRIRVVYGDLEPKKGSQPGVLAGQVEESLLSVSEDAASRGRLRRALTTAEASLGAPSRE